MDPGVRGGCAPGTFWNNLSQKKQGSDTKLAAGAEPSREFLTQPPAGYLKSTNTKATFEPHDEDADNPINWFRKKVSSDD